MAGRTKSVARTAGQNSRPRMCANMVELIGRFGSEDACELHMLSLRWPGGFECPRCGHGSYVRVAGRREFRCLSCSWQFSATSGTCLAHTRLSLAKWFRAAFLVTRDARGASAQSVARELGVSDATGVAVLRRLRTAMGLAVSLVTVGGDWVELDACDVTCGNSGTAGVAGSGATDAPVLLAVSATAMAGRVLSDQTAGTYEAFCAAHVSRRHQVRCDGLPAQSSALAGGWDAVARPSVSDGDSEASLPVVHHCISNLKAKLAGTCHGVSAARLQEHVDEFCWKYSHRGGDEMAELLLDIARAPHVPLSRIRSVRGPMEAHPAVREPGFRANHRLRKGWEDGERDRRPPILGRIASVLQGAAIRRLDEELAETEGRLSELVPPIEEALGLPDSLGRVA